MAFVSTNAWYFAFDAENLGWTFFLLTFAALCTYGALGFTLKRTHDNSEKMERHQKGKPFKSKFNLTKSCLRTKAVADNQLTQGRIQG